MSRGEGILLLKDLGNNLRRAIRAIVTEVITMMSWVAVAQAAELNKIIREKNSAQQSESIVQDTYFHNEENFRLVW